jgi:ABC-2 type transport system ATP-binding protein
MATPALKITNVSRTFTDIVALDSVSLEVKQGETYGLLGPNGAGKSTLINILSGVLRPDSGAMEFFGEQVVEPGIEFKMMMGVIPQEISLYDKLTARENLDFYGKLYGLDGATLRDRIGENLKLVGLTDRQNDRIEAYSGGMKRRINIAASILHNPKFILMDEPTVGIDPQSRNLIFEVIEKLHDEGATIIYTSHYMEEVERLCQNIAILDHGKVIAIGTRHELIESIGGVDTIEIDLESIDAGSQTELMTEFESMAPNFRDSKLLLKAPNGSRVLGAVIERLNRPGVEIKSVQIHEPNLESVFLHLTGKELRD